MQLSLASASFAELWEDRWTSSVRTMRSAIPESIHYQWMTSYRACHDVLEKDNSHTPVSLAGGSIASHNMLSMDGHEHAALRRIVEKCLAETLRADDPFAGIDSIVDSIDLNLPVELVDQFARPIALNTACRLVGVPLNNLRLVGKHLDRLRLLFNPIAPVTDVRTGLQSASALLRYIASLSSGSSSLKGCFAQLMLMSEGGLLSRNAALTSVVVLLHGAYENTANFLAFSGSLVMLDHQVNRLMRAPASVETRQRCLEELLRLATPVRILLRCDENAFQTPNGPSYQAVVLGDANRDPSVFSSTPYVSPMHLTFGRGAHRCPGSGIARRESSMALRLLAERVEDPFTLSRVQWNAHPVLFGPTLLLFQKRDTVVHVEHGQERT